MNRHRLTVFVAFAAGLCLGAGIVWYLVEQTVAPAQVATGVYGKPQGPLGPEPLPPSGSEFSSESPASPDRHVEAQKLLAETFAAIPTLKTGDYQPAVVSLIHRLRGLGPPGLQAIRDFLVSGDDVGLTEYRIKTGSHSFGLPTLRKALIHSLADWPDGPVAIQLSQDILRDSENVEEAVLAIRNLEKQAPGLHREEALQALRELIGAQPLSSLREAQEIIETASHFRATEFMPQLEQLLAQWPSIVNDYFGALATFPVADRRAAVSRAITNAEVMAEISSRPTVLTQLDLTDPVMRSHVVQVFAKLPASQREVYLERFGENASYIWGFSLLREHSPGKDRGQLRREMAAKLEMINALVSFATTPVLQQRLAEARSKLSEELQRLN